jgi:hypothetical protein
MRSASKCKRAAAAPETLLHRTVDLVQASSLTPLEEVMTIAGRSL